MDHLPSYTCRRVCLQNNCTQSAKLVMEGALKVIKMGAKGSFSLPGTK